MKELFNKLWHGQDGVSMLIVLGFMALSVPIVTGFLSFTSTLSHDSRVKTNIVQAQYSAQGCTQHAAYRLNNEANYATNLAIGVPNVYNFDGCTITVTKVSTSVSAENAYADVVLLLDVSGSVDAGELVYLKEASNTIVDGFDLENTQGRIRIGAIRFRGNSESVTDMTDVDVHGVSEPLHDGINGLAQGGPGLNSGTNIVSGLNAASAHFSTGLGDRVDPPYPVPNIMVVITDGNDTAGNSDGAIKNASDNTGAEVFAVGVGEDIEGGTLTAIASDPDAAHTFTSSEYSGLLAIINNIVTAIYGASAIGTTFTIQSISPDGTVSISEIILPPE